MPSQTSSSMQVSMIKAFSDNYIWAISTTASDAIVLVDPGDAEVCLQYLAQHNKKLAAILITHHHPDHVGGIKKLIDYCQQHKQPVSVYGPKNEDIANCDIKLKEQDQFTIDALGFTFSVLDVPGHTLGHIAYLSENNLFCGDTLFSAGCGRLFEGSPEQMFYSLNKLAALPEHTKVYCAHEYTLANVNFALAVEPNNFDIIDYFNQVTDLRNKDKATIPSTIKQEKLINPFLRCQQTSVMASASEYSNKTITDPIETFTVIRSWKDNF